MTIEALLVMGYAGGGMTKWLRRGRARDLFLSFAAGAALLLASLVNFLSHNGYPYFRAEVALVALGLLGIAALLAPIYLGQRQLGRSLLEGLLVAVFVDLNMDAPLLALGLGAAVGLFSWWRRLSLIGPMAVIGSVILVTTVAGLGRTADWIRVERTGETAGLRDPSLGKPPVVHLLLDEHIGIEGLPDDPEGRQLRSELRSTYQRLGFAVYGRAYSRHFHTGNAIPEMLNYGRRLAKKASKVDVETGPTDHLEGFLRQNYRVTVFQSDYVDYCTGVKVHECVTYDSASLSPTLAVPLAVADRASLVTLKFLTLSEIFASGSKGWNLAAALLHKVGLSLPVYSPTRGRSSTVATLEALDELTPRLKSLQAGEMILAHLLLPHYPFVVRRDCGYLPFRQWSDVYSRSPIEMRRRASYEQVRCAARKVELLLSAIAQSPGGRDAVVIIHGDHGSRINQRIPAAHNFGRLSDDDMLAGFSTFFAVRGRGVRPGYSDEPHPVSALLRDFTAAGFRSAPRPEPPPVPTVYLADGQWRPVRRVRMPPSWRQTRPGPEAAAETSH